MPYFLVPDQGVQYFDSEDDYNTLINKEKLTSPYATEASQEPEPAQPVQPETPAQPEKGPDWWEDTVNFAKEVLPTIGGELLRVPASMAVQMAEDTTEGFQQLVQTTPQYMAQIGAMGAFGTDPNLAYVSQLAMRQQADPESLKDVELEEGVFVPEFVAKDRVQAEIGAKYAALGLQVPAKDGVVKPLGMGQDTPFVNLFAKGGAIYEATNPKTQIGRDISDVGTIILTSMLMPNIGPSTAQTRIRAGERLIRRAALRPTPANLRQAGAVVTKRIGLDLPQDAMEELLLGSTVRVDAQTEAQVGAALDQIANDDKDDLLRYLLADTDAEEDYYAKRVANFTAGMGAGAAFRGSMALVKNTLKRRAIRQLSESKTLTRQEKLQLKEQTVKLDTQEQNIVEEVTDEAVDLQQRTTVDALSKITRGYNHEYEQSLATLNDGAQGLMRAQDAILGTSQEAIGFGRRSIELGAEADVDIKEIDNLTKLAKARQSALREMDRAAKADPNYLKKPSNKARYNRYKKQQAEYETRIKELETSTYGRLEEVESIEQRELMSGQQMDSMLAAQRIGRETFQTNIDTFMQRINQLEEQFDANNQGIPTESRGDLNYRAGVSRLRQAYNRYQELLPQAVEGVEDPTIDLAKIKNERQLLETIQELFNEIPGGSSINKVELKPEVVKEAVKRLQAEAAPKPQPKAPEPKETPEPKSEATEEPAKVVQAEVVENPWETSTQLPLRQLDTANEAEIVPSANPNIKTGFTEQPPVTKEVEARQAETELFGDKPADLEGISDEVRRASSDEAQGEFWQNFAEEYSRNDTGWGARADRSLVRSVNGIGDNAGRMLKLLSDKKFEKMPKSALPNAMRAMGGYMDALANAEVAESMGLGSLAEFMESGALKNQKLLKNLNQAIKYSLATGLNVGVGAERLAIAAQKTQKFLDAGMSDQRTYRLHLAVQAKEALLLYRSLGDFMQFRNSAGNFLASFQGKYRVYLAQQMRKVRGGLVKGADLEADLQEFAEAAQKELAVKTESVKRGLDEYIGLPSHLHRVQEILDKASDPDAILDGTEEGVFNELINNLVFASANPHLLGSKPLEGDGILVRVLRSSGLTGLSTQFVQPAQALVMTSGDFVQKLAAGPSMQLSNFIRTTLGGRADKQAQLEADKMTRIALNMFRVDAQTYGVAANNARTLRLFNRSTIDDTTTSKFGRQMMTDPLREAAILKDLNSKEAPDNTSFKALVRLFGQERAQQIYNKYNVTRKQFNDLFFLGDADKAMQAGGKGSIGSTASFFNKASLQGAAQVGLQELNNRTGGRSFASPYTSKYPGGERVGGNIGFVGAEWGTEYISSIYAQVVSKASAMDEVAAMTNADGLAQYKRGTSAFDLAVEKQFYTKYTEPIFAGIGQDMQEIGYAIKNQEAIDLAKYVDMQEEFVEGTIKGDVGLGFSDFATKRYKLLAAVISPYIKAPLNNIARMAYLQPVMGPLPLGVFAEAAEMTWHNTFKKWRYFSQSQGADAYKKWQRSERKILGFQSQLNHPNAYVRQRANSALILATSLNAGFISLVTSSDLEVTGGQKGTYKNSLYPEIPAYHIKMGGQWYPYRYIPFLGELLAYSANMRDYIRSENLSDSQHFFGAGISATAMSILDNPAVQGLDTIIGALQDPHKAESLIYSFVEKVTQGQLIGLRKFALTTMGPDVYKTKRIITGSRAGMLQTASVDVENLSAEELEEVQKTQYMEKVRMAAVGAGDSLKSVAEKPLVFGLGLANKLADTMGLASVVEYLDAHVNSEEVEEGDYRVAHWYKTGDVTYPGVRERTFFSSVAGKLVPFPAQGDTVDNELFLNGVRPPEQVFRKFGILANEVALNRFRRYMGTEFRYQAPDGNEYSSYEMFERLINGTDTVEGLQTYDQLPDDYKVALNLDAAERPPVFSSFDSKTKREALEDLKQEMIAQARVEFLTGTRSVVMPDGSVNEVPVELAAPADMQEEYQKYMIKKPARS